MSTQGKIKTLFSDKEKTEALFPRTKINAVSDENGKGLNAILDDMAYVGDITEDVASTPVNADLLGGRPAGEYATQNYVANEIAKAQLEGEDVDLSGYATKDEMSAAVNGIDFPVDSVNGRTGAITLSASDVGARPDTWFPTIAEIGAAPAGYGLGGEAKKLTSADDVNTTWQSGWYHWGESAPQNAPKISAYGTGYGAMQVDGANATNFIQTVWSGYSNVLGAQLRRRVVEGVDRGWEWVNPPMVLGKEYRTTERWNGKAVYTMLVDCGTMPNKTDKTVTTTITGNAEIVRFDVVYKNKNGNYMGNPMVDYTTGDIFGRLTITNTGNIAIRTYADVTDVSAMCRIWYTKD